MEPRYFEGPDGECLMLHRPTEEQVEAFREMGLREISEEEYRDREKEKIGTQEGPPTGGYSEKEPAP